MQLLSAPTARTSFVCRPTPHTLSFVMRGAAKQSSKLCTHANACDIIIHWITTVAMLPRDDKKHHTQFPSMEGCRAAAGWSEKPRKCYILIHPCHPGARGPHKNECFCGVHFDPRIQVDYVRTLSRVRYFCMTWTPVSSTGVTKKKSPE